MIVFEKIRWKNLLSTGNTFTEVILNSHPTTLILGSNGSGKSTLLDALCYGLYKKPFRKINKDQLVNTVNNGDCVIEIEFEIGTNRYLVRRGIKPDFFELIENGEPPKPKNAAKKDDQAYLIEDVLQSSFEAFTQVVILGNAKYTPFMQLTTPKRREFIEQILDIGVFSTMNEVLAKRQKDLKIEMDSTNKDLVVQREKIALVQEFIRKSREEANKAKDDIVAKVTQGNESADALMQEFNDITVEIEHLAQSIADNDVVIKKSQTYEDHREKFQSFITNAENKISFYTENETCKTCGQSIEETHRNTIISEKHQTIEKYQKALQGVQEKQALFDSRLTEIRAVNRQIQKLNLQAQEKANSARAVRTYVKKLEADLQKTPGNVAEHEEKLIALEAKYARLEKQKEDGVEQRHFFDVASVLLKDTGIKAAIIKQYLPAINRLVNKYLEDLDFFLSFSLDEAFNETFKSRHRDALSYYSFSEGEKLRIDLALLFAWREIARMKNSCSTNLLVLDEVIDSSLDNNGTDYVIKLFNDLGQNSNVMVISHKNDAALDMFAHVIKFEKIANFSRLVAE